MSLTELSNPIFKYGDPEIHESWRLPHAASAMIIRPDGSILSVSRKHDPTDLGLPGGKVDSGEDFWDAVVRETFEETGLKVMDCMAIYGASCGTPGVHNVHWNLTFLCRAEGVVGSTEKGVVGWVTPTRLVMSETGKLNSFGFYNSEVFRCMKERKVPYSDWISVI